MFPCFVWRTAVDSWKLFTFPVDCPAFQEAYEAGFLVKDERSHTALTAWWHGDKATILDFSNKGNLEF